MKIEIKKFGDFLISRPEGRDAALVIRHQFLDKSTETSVELDFEGVRVLTPSWLHEILIEIYKTIPVDKVQFLNITNSSVKASLSIIQSK